MKMEIKNNNIVVLRNGKIGYVASFNGHPATLIFYNYTNIVSAYNDDLRKSKTNRDYDIMAIYDGSSVENEREIFYKKFDVNSLKLLWEREEETTEK